MVQARPIPGYTATSEDDQMMANGSHEEINLEARRRHRQEKLPPLSPSLDAAAENQSETEEAEKILTIEEAQTEAEAQGEVIEQKLSRGQKISNFFKSLGHRQDNHDESGSPKKKQVRFFGRKKDSGASNDTEADAKKDEDNANEDDEKASEEQQNDDPKEEVLKIHINCQFQSCKFRSFIGKRVRR